MPTDPRLVIRQLFDPGVDCKVTDSNLYIEDGSTVAKYEADYEYGELMLERLMLENPFNIDIIFIISLIGEDSPDSGPSGPICYNYIIGVQSVTIHKWDSDGAMTVDGIKLGQKAVDEVKRVIRENPYGSLRAVRGRTENVTRLIGSDLIFGDIVEVNYKQYATRY